MSKEEFALAMVFLGTAYNKEFTSQQVSVWYEMFKEYKKEDFKTAIKRLINKNKYLPSIAEIKSEIALLNNSELQLNAEQEFEKVLLAVRKWGTLDKVGFEKITMETIRAIGQRRLELIETANIPFIKKEFIEIWNNKRDGIEHISIQNNNVLTYKEEIKKQLLEEDRRLLLEIGE